MFNILLIDSETMNKYNHTYAPYSKNGRKNQNGEKFTQRPKLCPVEIVVIGDSTMKLIGENFRKSCRKPQAVVNRCFPGASFLQVCNQVHHFCCINISKSSSYKA